MKKLIIFLNVQLLLALFLCSPAFAADNPYTGSAESFAQIMSSQYIRSYDATLYADSNGILDLDCTVTGTGLMDVIGMKTIQLQKYVSGSWTDVKIWINNYEYKSLRANAYYSYQGTSGSLYRAVVTFYAANQSGSDTKVITTSNVIAK